MVSHAVAQIASGAYIGASYGAHLLRTAFQEYKSMLADS